MEAVCLALANLIGRTNEINHLMNSRRWICYAVILWQQPPHTG